jgi:hypothetical protein
MGFRHRSRKIEIEKSSQTKSSQAAKSRNHLSKLNVTFSEEKFLEGFESGKTRYSIQSIINFHYATYMVVDGKIEEKMSRQVSICNV